MDCQNLNSLRHNETRRRQALFLRIAALCLGSAATGVLFLPVFHGVFNNLSYSLNGYQLLTASLRVNDSVIPLPLSLRLALAGVLAGCIGGGVLLVLKKASAAGGAYAAGALCAVMLLSGSASLQERVAAVGVDNIHLSMQSGFFWRWPFPCLPRR